MGNLWLETPLIYSPHISARLGSKAYLKLESLQPSQSFKYRGISLLIQRALAEHGPTVHLIVASGGNAGLAAACAANALGLRCTVYLPRGASSYVLEFFKQANADVQEKGDYYAQTLNTAKEAVASEPKAVLVPAYEDPILWEGHGSMIEEIAKQIPGSKKPDAIFCSVGGGGLLGGVITGCKTVGWDDVPVVGLETTGSNCFYRSLSLNPGPFVKDTLDLGNIEVLEDAEHGIKIAKLDKITSRAASLGASSPAPGVVKMALLRKGGIKSVCTSDELSMHAGLQFIEEHKMLVELACSTTLIPAYSKDLFERLVPKRSDGDERVVVFIVCGGFKITLSEMTEYQTLVTERLAQGPGHWDVYCNGDKWSIAQ
ncbi:hypothetical protein QCA50_002781 [Cerrena zonata]|uniref:L-serine ammonia-lyase n=1 Tax=Cerrena zonata TaxID=2478898 RepID=A0AAW0GQA8_9APHY